MYFAYFRTIMSYGLIFSGNFSHSAKIFKIWKNIIRIITGCKKDSCSDLFKNVRILPFQSQFILSLLLFVVNNKNNFKLNSDIHHVNTRQKRDSHQPFSDLLLYQIGVYLTGINVFNRLPQSIKNVSDIHKQFKTSLNNYLHIHISTLHKNNLM
jgi:hypothetical protein